MGVVLLFIAMYFLSIHCNPNIRCAVIYWIPSAITVFYLQQEIKVKVVLLGYSIINSCYG